LRHEEPVGHEIAATGWTVTPGTGALQPLPDAPERMVQIIPSRPVRGAYHIRIELAADGMQVVRIGLLYSDGQRAWERNVFLDVDQPGALHHELERVGLYHNVADNCFELELEGALLPGEELRALRLHPADADLQDRPPETGMAINLQHVDVAQTTSCSDMVRFVPDQLEGRPGPNKGKDRLRDAVVFAWFVPERMPELGEYYLGLLRYYHPDSKLFIGMNHGSDPAWEGNFRESGLDAEVRWARPEVGDFWDATGFQTALEGFHLNNERFDLVWFGHTKGGSQAEFSTYVLWRFAVQRNYWTRRAAVESMFEDPKIGVFAPHWCPLPPPSWGPEFSAFLHIYRDRCAPLGLHARGTFYVMRDQIVRDFCDAVGCEFFRTPLGAFGASRYLFEIGIPSVASMQGYEPFIDRDVPGENDPRDDIWLSYDQKQNHRIALAELERWRTDRFAFQPRAMYWDQFLPDEWTE
jgi:hypothetical protein